MIIPKIIHFIRYDGATHEDYNLVQQWESMNPGYTVMFWDEDTLLNFFKKYYARYVDIWTTYTYIPQRVHAASYFLVRKYGGVFVNQDVVGPRDLSSLPDADFIGFVASGKKLLSTNLFAGRADNRPMHLLTDMLWSTFNYKQTFPSRESQIAFTTGSPVLTSCVQESLDSPQGQRISLLTLNDSLIEEVKRGGQNSFILLTLLMLGAVGTALFICKDN